MNTPTPLPWRYNPRYALIHNSKQGYIEGSKTVCNMNTNNENEQANAELIVRAVNYHDRMVDMVQKLSDELGYSLSNSASVMGVKFTPTDNSLIKSAQQLLTEIKESK